MMELEAKGLKMEEQLIKLEKIFQALGWYLVNNMPIEQGNEIN